MGTGELCSYRVTGLQEGDWKPGLVNSLPALGQPTGRTKKLKLENERTVCKYIGDMSGARRNVQGRCPGKKGLFLCMCDLWGF